MAGDGLMDVIIADGAMMRAVVDVRSCVRISLRLLFPLMPLLFELLD